MEVLGTIDQALRKEFDANRRVLTFDEYLTLVGEQPQSQLRGSAKYVVDMLEHEGRVPAGRGAGASERFRVFDQPIDGGAPGHHRRVVGQEQVQQQIFRSLRAFVRQGVNNKLLLLHGPNGSSKTSIAHALMAGMERYSHAPQGAVYRFNWVFPHERSVKASMGLNQYDTPRAQAQSYARLPDDEVSARVPCELRDHPLLLVPLDQRRAAVESLVGPARAADFWKAMPQYLTRGGLCHRCQQIFESLLTANQGDYRRVLAHVQVERFYYSRRYRNGLVSIEPQMHVDASVQQLTMNKSMASLPASLQSLNLFSVTGDLVDGNRGLIEYSDMLKRPVDAFKYLLMACETGAVNVGNSIAHLDAVLIGSANELQLDAFKEFPDFMSFKARMELIRVPYLLSVTQEAEIYATDVESVSAEKHAAPHVAWTLAQWAVLTRLKKPNGINYPPEASTLISNLGPLEKSRLYDTGEMPVALNPEERKFLRGSLGRLRDEYANIPYYEGRMGASAREMKSILHSAAANPEFACVSPLAVLREMEEFVKRITEYEFLKQDVKEGYHDAAEFINVVRGEYLGRIDREVRDSIGLYDTAQWEDFLRRYVQHVALVLKKEKIKNPITGKMEDPDLALIGEFERIVGAPGDAAEREAFRQGTLSQVGAWSLDHPGEPVVYAKVFPEYWAKLEKHYYESQKSKLTKMHDALLLYGQDANAKPGASVSEEGTQLARQTVENMKAKLGYCEHCAKEVITFLMRTKY